ncbi:hypothetical protein TNCV_2779481 [Trichonephila clavipes]|nr:hypothetical protein TNCV_2779481 [Trichonephila clavipes]
MSQTTGVAKRMRGFGVPWSWIVCGGSVFLLPRFSDLNHLDFFFSFHRKPFMFETMVATVEDLVARIVVTTADLTSTPDLFEGFQQSFVSQCRLCYDLHGLNFEQFL